MCCGVYSHVLRCVGLWNKGTIRHLSDLRLGIRRLSLLDGPGTWTAAHKGHTVIRQWLQPTMTVETMLDRLTLRLPRWLSQASRRATQILAVVVLAYIVLIMITLLSILETVDVSAQRCYIVLQPLTPAGPERSQRQNWIHWVPGSAGPSRKSGRTRA